MQYWIGVEALKNLSMSEVLRITNHDFLNELQIIKMYLDLERIEDAKRIIEEYSNRYKIFSNLNKLQWPKTFEWIQTFHFRYPAIELTLKSNVLIAQDMKKDAETVEYLEGAIQHVYQHLDPLIEQELILEVESNEDFKLIFHLKGKWDVEPFSKQQLSYMKVETIEESMNSWRFVLTFKE